MISSAHCSPAAINTLPFSNCEVTAHARVSLSETGVTGTTGMPSGVSSCLNDIPVALFSIRTVTGAPLASNTQITVGTRSLRAAFKIFADNIAWLFTNKISANSAITGATKTKITYDAKGLVTTGADLVAGDIPNLSAEKITSGTIPVTRGGTGVTSISTFITNNKLLCRQQIWGFGSKLPGQSSSVILGVGDSVAYGLGTTAAGQHGSNWTGSVAVFGRTLQQTSGILLWFSFSAKTSEYKNSTGNIKVSICYILDSKNVSNTDTAYFK